MKSVTIKDVAKLAEVSVSSVSRYINNPDSINPAAAFKIKNAIEEIGYMPNPFAQNLKKGHNNNIGIIVPDLGPYFSRVCRALSDFFYQHRYLLYVCEAGEDPERERYYIDELLRQRVAGLLVSSCGSNTPLLQSVAADFPNIVLFDRAEPDVVCDQVLEDNTTNSYEMTKYVLSKGHKDGILIFGAETSINTHQRMQGGKQALTEAGFSLEDMYIAINCKEPEFVRKAIQERRARSPKPTFLIAYNPHITESAIATLNQMEIVIPGDMEFAGFALEDFRSRYRYDFPCVQQSPYEMGIKAGELLLKKLRKPGRKFVPKQYYIENELILP